MATLTSFSGSITTDKESVTKNADFYQFVTWGERGPSKSTSWLGELLYFQESEKLCSHFLYKDQEFPLEAFGPTEHQFASQEYFCCNIFGLSSWVRFFFPKVLTVSLILPFKCDFQLLPLQGDKKPSIPVNLWIIPPSTVRKLGSHSQRPPFSARHGVGYATWSPVCQTKRSGARDRLRNCFCVLCLEGFILPTQKELLFMNKKYIETITENNKPNYVA